jgi:UMF1 family MFS transporter
MSTAVTAERAYRRRVNAWCMYDWANSAFHTTIMAALRPPYFLSVAAANLPATQASSIWGYSVSVSMLVVAFMVPILGAIADYTGSKKRFLLTFLAGAVVFTGLLFFVQRGDWLMAVVFFVLASIGSADAGV